MFCSHCGKEVDGNASFCPSCGASTGVSSNQPRVNNAASSPAPNPIYNNPQYNHAFPVQNQHMTPVNQKPNKSIFKKWWFWAIVAAILLVMFAGSGDDSDVPPMNSDSPSEQSSLPTDATIATSVEMSIAECVLYDEDGVRITVKGIEDSFTGPDIKLLVENNTNKNIAVGCSDFIVNGITMHGSLYIDVASGKKSNGTLSLYNSDLEVAGIEDITTIRTFEAYISDTDTYMKTKDISLEIKTSLAGIYEQEIDYSGILLFEQNGISIIAKGISDDFMGGTVTVLIKNESGEDILVQADNVSVNGYTISVLHSDAVCSGTVRFSQIDIFETYLEENDIEAIETVTFTLDILNPKTFQTITHTDELAMSVSE